MTDFTVSLGDAVELLLDHRGKTPKKLGTDWVDSGVQVVSAKLITGGRLNLDRERRYVDAATYVKWMPVPIQRGDLLLTSEAPLGEAALVDTDEPLVLGQRLFALRGRPGVADSRFLYYLFRSPVGRALLTERGSGTTVVGIRQSELRKVALPLPSFATQKCTADVLSAMDSLIDNNRRRIEVLEQMAQAIYREWFVHFRYPGHEDDDLVDSDLGPIPDGWEVTTCGEALAVLGGGTPSKKEASFWEDGTIPWFTPSDLTKRRSRFATDPDLSITEEGLRRSSARLFPAGSVLMTSRATLGVLGIASVDASCNQGFIVIPPDDRWPPSFIYEWLDDHAAELEALGTGATFKEITKGAFNKVPFVIPAPQVLDEFRSVAEAIDDDVRVVEEQNRRLAAIRDLLLPKLVTGEIDVSDLDLDALVEAAGA